MYRGTVKNNQIKTFLIRAVKMSIDDFDSGT
jgi:hypothetical protein